MTITTEVENYYSRVRADKNHRYRSWEHCYKFFQNKPEDTDMAALHLAFYLASWGMYRGSSFLLQKDYKVHEGAVLEVLNPKHEHLRDISFEDFTDENISILFSLIDNLKEHYRTINLSSTGSKNTGGATDTLITKILLGTLGCIPAYDRFFIDGIRATNELTYSGLKVANFKYLLDWGRDNSKEVNAIKNSIAGDVKYPVMKIVDMYFWRVGERINLEKKGQ